MANSHRSALGEANVRILLNVASQHEQRCSNDASEAWRACQISMRAFATTAQETTAADEATGSDEEAE